jgi:hypothetical protein
MTLGDPHQRRHGVAGEEALEVQLAHHVRARRATPVHLRDGKIGVRLCALSGRRRAALVG